MVRIWVASLHQELQRCDDAGVSVLFELLQSTARVDSNSCGAVAEDSAKTAQWAVFRARENPPSPPEAVSVKKSAGGFLFAQCSEVAGGMRTARARRFASRRAKTARWAVFRARENPPSPPEPSA